MENDKTKAKIVVDKDGSMTLVTDIINGTSKNRYISMASTATMKAMILLRA